MKLTPLLFLAVFLTGCTTHYLGIGVSEPETPLSHTFQSAVVQAEDMPAFLGPVLVSNFSVALAERGVQPVMADAEAVITLRYVHKDLSVPFDRDDFGSRIDQGVDSHFVAQVVAELRATGSDEILWTGSIQRIHNIRPGDHMHLGRAYVALLNAFRDLLSDLPV